MKKVNDIEMKRDGAMPIDREKIISKIGQCINTYDVVTGDCDDILRISKELANKSESPANFISLASETFKNDEDFIVVLYFVGFITAQNIINNAIVDSSELNNKNGRR